MTAIKYIFAYILGCLAALLIGKIVVVSGTQTTIDAWVLTLTVVGQDVGDRMMIASRALMDKNAGEALMGISYLVGQSILEEIMKFLAFYIAFRISKPNSLREIVITGIVVGVGFATVENIIYYYTTMLHLITGFVVRALGHALFAGIIALLFGLGYFSQMRWVDNGATQGINSWIIRYAERILQIVWTGCGLIGAAFLHGTINIFATLGGHAIAVIVMVGAWCLLGYYLMQPGSKRPYGIIIREVDLLRQIAEARDDLVNLEKTKHGVPRNSSEKSKWSTIWKRFAKR
jgi:RsiW-degrading membrane proteinase PrsW (M82 family)